MAWMWSSISSSCRCVPGCDKSRVLLLMSAFRTVHGGGLYRLAGLRTPGQIPLLSALYNEGTLSDSDPLP